MDNCGHGYGMDGLCYLYKHTWNYFFGLRFGFGWIGWLLGGLTWLG